MYRFTDPAESPPGNGFPYLQQENGFNLKAPTLRNLAEQVKAHRRANNIPIGVNIDAEVEDNSCREILKLYPNYTGCSDDSGQQPFRQSRFTVISQVLDFLKTCAVWIAKGCQFVDQEEANRRAQICAGCPKNRDVGQCIPCASKSLLAGIKGSRSTLYDDKLKVCEACGCWLPVKVWFPKEVMKRDGVEYEKGICWMLE